jgi:MFS family permease
MVVLDTAIINVALPVIKARLGFSPTSIQWAVTAYVLAFGGLLLFGGRAPATAPASTS